MHGRLGLSPSYGRTPWRGRAEAGVNCRDIRAVRRGRPLLAKLIEWRRERARADGVPAYVVADNKTLAAIAVRRPSLDAEGLLAVPGIGQRKVATYGDEILGLVSAH